MEKLIEAVVRTASDLWQKGWAERNAGNLSVSLAPDEFEGAVLTAGPWQPLGAPVEGAAGQRLLITATGSFMHNVGGAPTDCLGVVEVDAGGANWRRIWGFESGCTPTSELPAHLRAHAARGGDANRVIIHTHPQNLIALTYALDLDTASLTRLLWEMHSECIVVFPDGCGYVPWLVPGSDELAKATAEILERRALAVWQQHGVVAAGPDLDTAFGLIDTAEKAASIYFKAATLGPVTRRLTTEQLKALAARFDVHPDPDIL